jgi:hypothetical protein
MQSRTHWLSLLALLSTLCALVACSTADHAVAPVDVGMNAKDPLVAALVGARV